MVTALAINVLRSTASRGSSTFMGGALLLGNIGEILRWWVIHTLISWPNDSVFAFSHQTRRAIGLVSAPLNESFASML